MRKTKIVCTIGPASTSEEMIRGLMQAGMDVARLNFSHGDHEDKKIKIDAIKKVRRELKLHVAIMLDTKGPEIRTGKFKGGRAELLAGQTFTLTTDEVEGTGERASVTYKGLPQDVREGDRILIDDGLIEMKVKERSGADIVCKVINGGPVSDHKGVNVPDASLAMPYMSDRDRSDLLFGIREGVDFVAASFVRSAEDVRQIRSFLAENGGGHINIISKIENMQGMQNIDAIIDASDAIMVARGDMGVEVPFEDVPVFQKIIIKKAVGLGKQVITATQMLDSMIKNPRPTRAEAADVANAIYDGTSAVMLSGETAAGSYPIEAVSTMDRIARRTEEDIDYAARFRKRDFPEKADITNAISYATCTTAMNIRARAVITVTMSGFTAKMVARYRPDCTIVGCSDNDYVCRQLNLVWGIKPILIGKASNSDELMEDAEKKAMEHGYIERGNLAVLTAGVPIGTPGMTNLIKAIEVE